LTLLWGVSVEVRAADCTFRYQVTGSISNQGFGSAVATIGDVNGDGFPDFAVGAPAVQPGPTQIKPDVYVFSGRDGSFVYKQPGPGGSEFGSAIAALGDIDGDGVRDFLVGAPESVGPGGGCIFTLSGTYGSGVYTVVNPGPPGTRFGAAVAGGPDLDGDGIADFAVGAPGADTLAGPGSGAVFVYSGRDGHLLYRRDGQAAGDRFGSSVALFRVGTQPGPINAAALLVGAPGADVTNAATTLADAGAAYQFAASTGMMIRKLDGEGADDHLGESVAGLGDVDGDGYSDFVVGAPNALIAPGQRGGHVYVFSGASGAEIFVHHTTIQGDAYGPAAGGIADVTGDAVSDVLVGAPGDPAAPIALPGSVSVLSGGSGLELCRTNGFSGSAERFGTSVAALADLDGDGFPEWIGGAPGFSPGPLAAIGAVRTYGVAPGPPPGHPPFIEIDNRFPFTLNLKWSAVPATCAGVDYAVYMGTYLRTGQGLTNHLADTCSTGGATDITLPEPANFPPGSALYFIVTAETPNEEGSYGVGTLGNQHAPSHRPCRVFLNTESCFIP